MRYALIDISKYNIIILIVISLFFYSCETESLTYPDPFIEFESGELILSNDSTVLLNDTVTIIIYAETNSNNPLTQFSIESNQDGVITKIDSGIYVNSFSYEKQIVKGISDIEMWSFYVRDRNSRQSETITLNLNLDQASFYGNIIEIQSIVLGANENTSIGGFYSLSRNEVYTIEDAYNSQELINLAYFYDTLEGEDNTLSSPGANIDESVYPVSYHPSSWTIRNTTRFNIVDNISIEEYNNCANDSLILANTFEFATGKRKAKNLQANDIYSFVTDDGKKGLIRIIEAIGDSSGTLEFSIKMQE